VRYMYTTNQTRQDTGVTTDIYLDKQTKKTNKQTENKKSGN